MWNERVGTRFGCLLPYLMWWLIFSMYRIPVTSCPPCQTATTTYTCATLLDLLSFSLSIVREHVQTSLSVRRKLTSICPQENKLQYNGPFCLMTDLFVETWNCQKENGKEPFYINLFCTGLRVRNPIEMRTHLTRILTTIDGLSRDSIDKATVYIDDADKRLQCAMLHPE